MTFRSIILRAAGTNCDGETEAALLAAGSEVDRVHVNSLAEDPSLLGRYQLLVLAGGFTFGDDVASGAVFAHTLEQRLREPLESFVASGRRVLGVCNGFQILVRMGLLPGSGGRASLLTNASGKFEDRWVRVRAGSSPGPWLEPGREYFMPVAHAEGRFEYFSDSAEPFPESQVALRYMGANGSVDYPANPNGSHSDIAGITNEAGNVLGLMPHPERFYLPQHHPHWMRYRQSDGSPPAESDLPVPLGLDLYRRAVHEAL